MGFRLLQLGASSSRLLLLAKGWLSNSKSSLASGCIIRLLIYNLARRIYFYLLCQFHLWSCMSASYPFFSYGVAVMVILGLLAAYHMGDASALVLVWWPVSEYFLSLPNHTIFLGARLHSHIVCPYYSGEQSIGMVTVATDMWRWLY